MAKGRFMWRLWSWLKVLKNDAVILYYAWKHPQTPAYLKSIMLALVAYVFSPIDILPDYLPLVGLVDDAAIVPLTIYYLMHMLPPAVRSDCERESSKWRRRVPWVLILIGLLALVWLAIVIAGFSYIISWIFPG